MSARRKSVVLKPEAQRDLESIAQYTGQYCGATQRSAYVRVISRALTQLGENPHIGRVRDEIRSGLRSFGVRQHVISYRAEAGNVTVLRILHGKMDASDRVDIEAPMS